MGVENAWRPADCRQSGGIPAPARLREPVAVSGCTGRATPARGNGPVQEPGGGGGGTKGVRSVRDMPGPKGPDARPQLNRPPWEANSPILMLGALVLAEGTQEPFRARSTQ
jgi:hypothetical protein